MNKKRLIEVLGSPIAYYVEFAKLTGDVCAGVFLSQLFYWHGKGADRDGWIYKTRDEWRDETGLSRKNQETARKKLRELNLIEEKRAGVPAKLYYRINLDALTQFSGLHEPDQQDGPNRANWEDRFGPTNTETTTETTTESSNSRASAPFASAKAPPRAAAQPSHVAVQEKGNTTNEAIAKPRKRNTNNPAARQPTPQQEMFQAVCDAVGWDANTCNQGQVAQMVGKLNRGGYTPADVRTWREDVWPESFPGNKGGNPTLNQLGNGIAEVKRTAFVQQHPSTDWNAIFAGM